MYGKSRGLRGPACDRRAPPWQQVHRTAGFVLVGHAAKAAAKTAALQKNLADFGQVVSGAAIRRGEN